MGYPDYQLARAYKFWKRTAGDLLFATNTVWGPAPTVSTIVLEAEVGDGLEAFAQLTYGTEAAHAFLDVHTGANYFSADGSAGAEGVPGWAGIGGAAVRTGGICPYIVQSGDLSASGTVTLTLHYRTSSAVGGRTVRGTAIQPFFFGVKNVGPQDPY